MPFTGAAEVAVGAIFVLNINCWLLSKAAVYGQPTPLLYVVASQGEQSRFGEWNRRMFMVSLRQKCGANADDVYAKTIVPSSSQLSLIKPFGVFA